MSYGFEKYDCIVVGCGLYGCVMAECIAEQGFTCCVIEKRNHIGGNCYDTTDRATGIRYHVYGPHIFYSANDAVTAYISRFTRFTRYFHQVVSCY